MTLATGNGGDIDLAVAGNITMGNAGTISPNTTLGSEGDAGLLKVIADRIEISGLLSNTPAEYDLLTGISAVTNGTGTGGLIDVHARESIRFQSGGLMWIAVRMLEAVLRRPVAGDSASAGRVSAIVLEGNLQIL